MTPAPSPDVAGLVERDTVCAGDKPYTNGIRDLAEMPHVSEQLGNVFRDCARIIDERNDRIEVLEAEVERLRGVLEVVWKEAATMRNASKLVGPYPNEPANNRVWARSMYHAGKRIMEMLKPARAALETKHG